MRGIISEDFYRLLSEQQSLFRDLNQEIRNLKQSYFNLKKELKYDDLNFLVEKLELEIGDVDKVYNKLVAFQEVLKEVPDYYKETDQAVAYSVSQYDPNIN